jgi:hypothetical protein
MDKEEVYHAISKEQLDRLFELLELGLTSDGEHHKQWALVEVAELIGFKVGDELKEEAIAP